MTSNSIHISSQSLQIEPAPEPLVREIPPEPVVVHHRTMRENSIIILGSQALRVAVGGAANILQQTSNVYRSLAGLGLIVSDAVSGAEVGFAEQSTLSLTTQITDDLGQTVCTDIYKDVLPLTPRPGIPIADWKPLIFVGGIVLAETVRMLSVWLEREVLLSDEHDLARGLFARQVARHVARQETPLVSNPDDAASGSDASSMEFAMPMSPFDIDPQSGHEPDDTIGGEGQSRAEPSTEQSVKVPNPFWLKRGAQVASLVSMAGNAAMNVACAAELFRAGIPLMPYYGLNDLEVAEPSVQSIALKHEYQCSDTALGPFGVPSAKYDIDATLSLPGVLTSNIQAEALIGLLFRVGVGAQLFGQVCHRALSQVRQNHVVQTLAPMFAQKLAAGDTPLEVSQWLAKSLKDSDCIHVQTEQGLTDQLIATLTEEQGANFPRPTMIDSFQSAREAAINLIDRLANTALVASYAARLVTTGIPFISSGFNGLTAGAPVTIPIDVDKPAFWGDQFRGNLHIQGDAVIPGSRLDHIMTSFFLPLVVSSAALKLFATAAVLTHHEGGVEKSAQSLRRKPIKTSGYLTAQMILRVSQQVTGALGAFGLSLFLGAKIAADLVGGSRVESLGNLEGDFAFRSSFTLDGRPVVEQQLSNETFFDKIETIELPNPSQITGLTMMIGGFGGSALVGVSQVLRLLGHKLESISPIAACSPPDSSTS